MSEPAHRVPRVAAVVPCRNESATVTGLLDALAAQTRPLDRVVIVDDRSIDATRDTVTEWVAQHAHPPVDVLDGPGRGPGPAMNAGIAAVDADIIVRLDGHCLPGARYVQHSLEALALPGAGVSGGVWRIEPGNGSLAARGIAAVLSHPLGSGGADYRRPRSGPPGPPVAVDTVPFGAFQKDLWARLGGFDERLLRNQDYDFNYRVRREGLRVMLHPAVQSVYRARASFSALARQYYDYGFWKIVMLRKFPESLRIRQALPIALTPALAALTVLWSAGAGYAGFLLMSYLAVNAAGAAHAAVRAGDARIAGHAFTALLVLQVAWSSGAWVSLFSRGRAYAG